MAAMRFTSGEPSGAATKVLVVFLSSTSPFLSTLYVSCGLSGAEEGVCLISPSL